MRDWILKLRRMFADWFDKKTSTPLNLPEKPVPYEKPQPQNPLPVGVDAIVYESIHFEGGNNSSVGRNAVPVKVLRGARIVGDKIHLDYDKVTDWDAMEHVELDPVTGKEERWNSYGRLCCASNFKDGAWRGAHFDWLSGDQKVKLTKNIFDGYLFNPPPSQDARFMIWLLSNDGGKRSNVVEATR